MPIVMVLIAAITICFPVICPATIKFPVGGIAIDIAIRAIAEIIFIPSLLEPAGIAAIVISPSFKGVNKSSSSILLDADLIVKFIPFS